MFIEVVIFVSPRIVVLVMMMIKVFKMLELFVPCRIMSIMLQMVPIVVYLVVIGYSVLLLIRTVLGVIVRISVCRMVKRVETVMAGIMKTIMLYGRLFCELMIGMMVILGVRMVIIDCHFNVMSMHPAVFMINFRSERHVLIDLMRDCWCVPISELLDKTDEETGREVI